MITINQQERLIERFETLTELELDAVIKGLIGVLEKNKMMHLIDNSADLEEKVAKNNLQEIANLCESVEELEEYEKDAFDKLKKTLLEIKNIAE